VSDTNALVIGESFLGEKFALTYYFIGKSTRV